ncbi:MAG: hypothetical protein M3354_02020 [Chloroflexota bacterium]|nr:hypothetical protein [Chloroflexota bacterium]
MESLSPEYVKTLRQTRRLHPQLEARLQLLLDKAHVRGFALPEGWGLAGGHRSDLVAYLHERRVLHFEIFGSASTVHRDVNILLMSSADVRVALLMDREVDPRVADGYFRVVADNRFRWYWLSLFLDPANEALAVQTLGDLLQEAQQIGGPLVAQRPAVSIYPATGAPFSRAVVRVAGFHPDHDFSVFWDPDGITTLLGIGRGIASTGTGESEVFLPHGGIATPGQHIIRAVDSLGNVATTTFGVAPAWPAPSVRAVPSEAKPGEVISLVGGGAPAGKELTIFLWREHQGWGFAKVIPDERGEFSGSLEIPWLLGSLELVKPGRYKLSVSPTQGGPPFEAHTNMVIPPFSPPGVLEWQAGTSHKSYDVALLRPHFRVEGDRISVAMKIRNDRQQAIILVPQGLLAIIEITPELKQRGYEFECVAATTATIDPGMEVDASFDFRRNFEAMPADVFPPMRLIHLVLPIRTPDEGLVYLKQAETFPIEIWAG